MKKSAIFLILLLLPLVSAVEFDMPSEFKQNSNLLARVSGNFLDPILKSNIQFYRAHVKIPIDFDLLKIQDEYYISALLVGKEPNNNYSIKIEDVSYMKGSKSVDDPIIKKFEITNETVDFSVKPGIISTNDDFSIEIQNLKDAKSTITAVIGDASQEEIFKSGDIKTMSFKLEDKTTRFTNLQISSGTTIVDIPVYIFSDEPRVEKGKNLIFEISNQNIRLSTNTNQTRIIYLKNTGEETIDNITISVSESLKEKVNLSLTKVDALGKNKSIKLELYILEDSEEKTLDGTIKASADDITIFSDIYITYLKDYIPLDNETNGSGSTFDSDKPLINDDDKPSSTGKIIGWLLVAAIVGFLAWFLFKKYGKAKRPKKSLEEIAKGKKPIPDKIK